MLNTPKFFDDDLPWNLKFESVRVFFKLYSKLTSDDICGSFLLGKTPPEDVLRSGENPFGNYKRALFD